MHPCADAFARAPLFRRFSSRPHERRDALHHPGSRPGQGRKGHAASRSTRDVQLEDFPEANSPARLAITSILHAALTGFSANRPRWIRRSEDERTAGNEILIRRRGKNLVPCSFVENKTSLAFFHGIQSEIVLRISKSVLTTIRPAQGHAEESNESRNVDQRFDPLHGASKPRPSISSSMTGLPIHVGVNRADVRGFGRWTDY